MNASAKAQAAVRWSKAAYFSTSSFSSGISSCVTGCYGEEKRMQVCISTSDKLYCNAMYPS